MTSEEASTKVKYFRSYADYVNYINYFCIFCKSNGFVNRRKFEEHLNGHLIESEETQNLKEQNLAQIYKEKWVRSLADDQEVFFSINKDLEYGFRPNNRSLVARGCPVCDYLIEKYDVQMHIKIDEDLLNDLNKIYQHIYGHFGYNYFCSVCDYKSVSKCVVMAHLTKEHGELGKMTILDRKLLPQVNKFIKGYVRSKLTPKIKTKSILSFENQIFWKNGQERDYFCAFCPERRFKIGSEVKIHFEEHFDVHSKSGQQKNYLVKWIEAQLDFQEMLFTENSKPQSSLITNLSTRVGDRIKIFENCPVCSLICKVFNFNPIKLKTLDSNSKHINYHLQLQYFCDSCEFKSNYKQIMLKHDCKFNSKPGILFHSRIPIIKLWISKLYLKYDMK